MYISGITDGPVWIGRCEEIQAELRRNQTALVVEFDTRQITAEEYIDKFLILMKDGLVKIRAEIGDAAFFEHFGEAGEYPEGIIDREAFLECYKDRR